jgi:hypothetical protein
MRAKDLRGVPPSFFGAIRSWWVGGASQVKALKHKLYASSAAADRRNFPSEIKKTFRRMSVRRNVVRDDRKESPDIRALRNRTKWRKAKCRVLPAREILHDLPINQYL